ncbi:hypothetical protein [Streptomyces sp. NBC_01310]|uniref:hypothetical protein n=1 Tax=Streptomyces sp. NBC_01310 TaxID=2903820 RepID=UPI0035B5C042
MVPDDLWGRIDPLLPVRQRRPRHPGRLPLDDRGCLQGILFVLPTRPVQVGDADGGEVVVAAVAELGGEEPSPVGESAGQSTGGDALLVVLGE